MASIYSLLTTIAYSASLISASPPQKEKTVTLVAAGDTTSFDREDVFSTVQPLFRDSLTVLNLETALTDNKKPCFRNKRFHFRTPTYRARDLERASIEVVSLANNHTMDYCSRGLEDTIKALDANNIGHVGGGRNLDHARAPYLVTREGINFAFFGYTTNFPEGYATSSQPGTAPAGERIIEEDLTNVRYRYPFVNFVVVNMHWGEEREKVSEDQIQLAHKMVSWGADLIVGHHPHIVQEVEIYNGVPIIYSLGNFVSGKDHSKREGLDYRSPRNRYAVLFQGEFTSRGLSSYRLIPIDLREREGIPVFNSPSAQDILNQLQIESILRFGRSF